VFICLSWEKCPFKTSDHFKSVCCLLLRQVLYLLLNCIPSPRFFFFFGNILSLNSGPGRSSTTWTTPPVQQPLFFETGSHYVIQIGLKLLILLSAGITGVYHQTWPIVKFQEFIIYSKYYILSPFLLYIKHIVQNPPPPFFCTNIYWEPTVCQMLSKTLGMQRKDPSSGSGRDQVSEGQRQVCS
jgi:hypothetical protein